MLQISLSQLTRINTISLPETGAIITCMSKGCFDKLEPKPASVQTHICKVNGARWQ